MTKYIILVLLAAILTFQIFEARRINKIAEAFHDYNINVKKELEIIREDGRQRSILENELAECGDKAWRIKGVVDAMSTRLNKPIQKKH